MELTIVLVLIHTSAVYLNFGPRTVFGKDAALGEFPFMASVQFGTNHICGGSILTNTTILTAAHCLEVVTDPSILRVCVGTNDATGAAPAGECYQVCSILTHRDYHGLEDQYYAYSNDLTLLTLETPLTFSKNVQAIRLRYFKIPNGEPLTVVGWGKSAWLQKTGSEYINNRACQRGFIVSGVIHRNQFCFFNGPETSHEACTVNSGSAILYRKRLVGVVSSGAQECVVMFPSVATDLTHYFLWIKKNIIFPPLSSVYYGDTRTLI